MVAKNKTDMHNSTPTAGSGQQNIVSIDWKLLGLRLRASAGQMFSSARYHVKTTEYTPPTWFTRMRLTWFRLGLIALVVFVFTQKQVDLSLSMGANGIAVDRGEEGDKAPATANTALSMLPGTASSVDTRETLPPVWNVNSLSTDVVRAYVDRFERVALTEESKFGIPTTAKLAMAVYESDGGHSAAARNDNNHFQLGCAGKRYDNAWASWRGHSEDLTRRFPDLAGTADIGFRQWIDALDNSGYSRDPDYGKKLLRLIDRFGLER